MAIRTINAVRNPIWADFNQTAVNLEVDFEELDGEYVLFTATSFDPESYGVELYNNAIAGMYGPIAPFVPPPNIIGEEAINIMRQRRNYLLEQSDYIELPSKWTTLTPEKQTEWTVYRNGLRDLPENYPAPELRWNSDYTDVSWYNVEWPTKPE